MYYKIRIDGKDVGDFGHDNVKNLHLSVSGGPDGMYVFAGAVCEEDGKQFHCDWLQKEVDHGPVVQIEPSDTKNVPEPIKKFRMGRHKHEPSEGRMCDFCQRKETEVPTLIYVDEHRPSICSDCVNLCNGILEQMEEAE